jgi:hypothetical protein
MAEKTPQSVLSVETESEEPFVILSAKRKDMKFQFDVDIGAEAKSRAHFSKQHA